MASVSSNSSDGFTGANDDNPVGRLFSPLVLGDPCAVVGRRDSDETDEILPSLEESFLHTLLTRRAKKLPPA